MAENLKTFQEDPQFPSSEENLNPLPIGDKPIKSQANFFEIMRDGLTPDKMIMPEDRMPSVWRNSTKQPNNKTP